MDENLGRKIEIWLDLNCDTHNKIPNNYTTIK